MPVPLGLGWAWLAWAIVVAVPAFLPGAPSRSLGVPVLVAGTAALGWFDDRFGRGDARGFRGHLSALRSARVTTGLVKLAGIVALSLFVFWHGVPQTPRAAALWLLRAAIVAMSANLLNLLDLRPGRALKAYVALAVLGALALGSLVLPAPGAVPGATLAALGTLVLILGPAVACFRADLRERAMLGDMGANAAGALAGWALASGLPLPGLAIAAAVLLVLNLASERVSFSAVIEGNAGLRWLDGLGRRAAEGETGP
jgi:UDP-GlcNAc:undecaprenyl-phosphate/decaprenyl-phosphate GlcNAc-1-phosphate transferase